MWKRPPWSLSSGAGGPFCLRSLLQGWLLCCFESNLFLVFSKASYIFLKGDNYENSDLVEEEESCSDGNICNKYLHQASSLLASDCIGGITDAASTCLQFIYLAVLWLFFVIVLHVWRISMQYMYHHIIYWFSMYYALNIHGLYFRP